MKIVQLFILIVFISFSSSQNQLKAQCTNAEDIETFNHDEKSYEIVKDKKTWQEAADCAVERGGILTEINNLEEQQAIFDALKNANIEVSQTRAPDGGNGSYVWLGGNDISIEGNWIWDGDGDSTGVQFWIGKADGSAIDNQYTNWGNEPDDFQMQDALGLSLNGWPLGEAGEWNDISKTNKLYFIIEYDSLLTLNTVNFSNQSVKLYPNPVKDQLTIESQLKNLEQLVLVSFSGKKINEFQLKRDGTQKINLTGLNSGVFLAQFITIDGKIDYAKIVK